MAGLASRPRDAGRRRCDRARRFRDARFTTPARLDVHQADGKFFVSTDGPDGKLPTTRLPTPSGSPAAAVPDRVSRRTPPGVRRRVGLAPEGVRAASAGSISTRGEDHRATAALDGDLPELELHVRRVPLDRPRKNYDAETRRRTRRRGPRSTSRARRATVPARTTCLGAGGRRRRRPPTARGASPCARRAQGVMDANRGDRQREAERAARVVARARNLRPLPCARARASATTTCTASRRSTRIGSRC